MPILPQLSSIVESTAGAWLNRSFYPEGGAPIPLATGGLGSLPNLFAINRVCDRSRAATNSREPPAKRWAEIEYMIRGDKFDVAFTYPEEIDEHEEPFERRGRVVARYFGDKPIVYPPPPEDDGQNFEL